MYDIFLVEDETLIRMMVAEMAEELGHCVVAEAGSIEDAQPLAENARFDLAILDVNIGGRNICPIAQIVEGRGVPLLFASGYGNTGLPEPFKDRKILRKLFQIEELSKAIDFVFTRAAGKF